MYDLHPTRLNTFLELKVENERLQQRLADLRVRIPPHPPVNTGPSMASMYSAPPTSSAALCSIGKLAATYYTNHHTSAPYDDLLTQGNHHQPQNYTDTSNPYGNYPLVSHQPVEDTYGEDVTRRKKVCVVMKQI